MKAAVFYGTKDMKVIETNEPVIEYGDVLVKVKYGGICGTDNLIYNGLRRVNTPVILGHEYSGDVVAVDKGVAHSKVGDRVVIDPNIFCGKCPYCRKGKVHLCDSLISLGVTKNGGFAEYCAVPEKNVYRLDDALEYDEGALVEPLACCVHGMEKLSLDSADTVMILGAGLIGNIMIQLARLYGASKVVAGEPLENRRALAKKSGADYVLDATSPDFFDKVRAAAHEGIDAVIECSGNPRAQESAYKIVNKGGKVLWFGCAPDESRLALAPSVINHREIALIGSTNNPFAHLKALKLMSNKQVRLRYLISHKMGLDDIGEAFRLFGSEEAVKILIAPNH